MKKLLILSIVALSIVMSSSARSELVDYGLDGEMFHDTITGLYWYDPGEFLGWSREEIDLFLADNPEWKLASQLEIVSLYLNYTYISGSQPGSSMVAYLGEPTYITSTHIYWRGYYLNTPYSYPSSNAYLNENLWCEGGFSGVSTSARLPIDGQLIGAWINTDIDPLSEPDPEEILINTVGIVNTLSVTGVLVNPNMDEPLSHKISAVLSMIEQGLYVDALDKLEQDILQKTDGCATIGAPDSNDWIMDCVAQKKVYDNIREVIGILITL